MGDFSRAGMLRVITASEDGTARAWCFDERSFYCEAMLPSQNAPDHGHNLAITSVKTLNTELVVTSSEDHTAKIWKARRGASSRYQDTDGCVYACIRTLHQDAEHISGYVQGGSNLEMSHAPIHSDYVNMVEGNKTGDKVVTCSDDNSAVVWDVESGTKEFVMENKQGEMQGHTAPVSMAAWANTHNKVVTCSQDRSCIVWDVTHQIALRSFPKSLQDKDAHSAAVLSCQFNCDDTQVVTASKDGTAKIWDVQFGANSVTLGGEKGHTDMVVSAKYNPNDQNQVLTCSFDCKAILWDIRDRRPSKVFDKHTGCVWSAEFANTSACRHYVLTASHDMSALIYDQRLGVPKHTLLGHTGMVWQASFNKNDQWVITCSDDHTARVWSLSTGNRRPPSHALWEPHQRHTQPVTSACFVPEPDR